jgi:hypothetical protein
MSLQAMTQVQLQQPSSPTAALGLVQQQQNANSQARAVCVWVMITATVSVMAEEFTQTQDPIKNALTKEGKKIHAHAGFVVTVASKVRPWSGWRRK